MKISRTVWIDDKVKWNALRKRDLYKKNHYKGMAYIVCTSPHPKLLFEIIEARQLNDWYSTSTLIALCRSRQQALEVVRKLIDALYNEKSITYEELQQ